MAGFATSANGRFSAVHRGNRGAFQIIDRHAYRAVYGDDYPLYASSSDESKIDIYFRYLDALFALAESKDVDFETLDRVL